MITERGVLYTLVAVLAIVTGGLIAERMTTDLDCVIESVDIGPRTE